MSFFETNSREGQRPSWSPGDLRRNTVHWRRHVYNPRNTKWWLHTDTRNPFKVSFSEKKHVYDNYNITNKNVLTSTTFTRAVIFVDRKTADIWHTLWAPNGYLTTTIATMWFWGFWGYLALLVEKDIMPGSKSLLQYHRVDSDCVLLPLSFRIQVQWKTTCQLWTVSTVSRCIFRLRPWHTFGQRFESNPTMKI